MVFNTLNIWDGGGFDLIPESAKYRWGDSPMLAVGLGWRGVWALRSFKKEMFRRFRMDDPFKHVRFLGIDSSPFSTDPGLESPMGLREYDTCDQEGSEGICVCFVPGIDSWGDFEGERERYERDPRFRGWSGMDRVTRYAKSNPDEQLTFSTDDRDAGRFLLMLEAEYIVNRLRAMAASATRGVNPMTPVDVVVFTDISGGIGSGASLDLGYMIRKALEAYATVRVHAFLIPGYDTLGELFAGDASSTWGNAGAMLRDLDGHLGNGGMVWKQEYGEHGDLLVETTEPPFDRCHLVSVGILPPYLSKAAWELQRDLYNDWLADCVIDMLAGGADDAGSGDDDGDGTGNPVFDCLSTMSVSVPYSFMLDCLLAQSGTRLANMLYGWDMSREEAIRLQKTVMAHPEILDDVKRLDAEHEALYSTIVGGKTIREWANADRSGNVWLNMAKYMISLGENPSGVGGGERRGVCHSLGIDYSDYFGYDLDISFYWADFNFPDSSDSDFDPDSYSLDSDGYVNRFPVVSDESADVIPPARQNDVPNVFDGVPVEEVRHAYYEHNRIADGIARLADEIAKELDSYESVLSELDWVIEDFRTTFRERFGVKDRDELVALMSTEEGRRVFAWPYDRALRIVAETPFDADATARDLLWTLAGDGGDGPDGRPCTDELTAYRRVSRFAKERFPGIVNLKMSDFTDDRMLHDVLDRLVASATSVGETHGADGAIDDDDAVWRTVITVPTNDPPLLQAARSYAESHPRTVVRLDPMPGTIRVMCRG